MGVFLHGSGRNLIMRNRRGGFRNQLLIFLLQPFDGLTAQLCKATRRKEQLEVFAYRDFNTFVWCVAKFRQLSDDVVTLWLLRQLVLSFDCYFHATTSDNCGGEAESRRHDVKTQADGDFTLCTGAFQSGFKLTVAVSVKTLAGT